jgi:hypothetical protein
MNPKLPTNSPWRLHCLLRAAATRFLPQAPLLRSCIGIAGAGSSPTTSDGGRLFRRAPTSLGILIVIRQGA